MFNPDKYQPYYNHMTKILKNSGVSIYDFQSYLLNRIKKYFQELDGDVTVNLLSPNYYPSDFVIQYKNRPVLNFSIYEHIYDPTNKHLTKVNHLKVALAFKKNHYNKLLKKLSNYKGYKSKPFSMLHKKNYSENRTIIRLIKDFFILIFKWKTIQSNLDKTIDSYKKELEGQKEEITSLKKQITEIEKIIPDINRKISEWESRFKKWGYKKASM